MNLGGIGAAFTGFNQGLDEATKRRMQQEQLAQAQQQAAARGALAKSMTQGPPQIPGAQPMPPGVTPPQAQQPPSLGSLGMLGQPQGGPQQPPAGGAPPQSAPPPMSGSGPPLMGGPQAPQAGGAPPPMAGGGAPPASPGLGAGGAAPNGQGGFVQSTQDTLRGIYQNIAKANPNIKPSALFEAAQLQIGQMKGIEPDTKMYMQAQIAEQKIDMEAKMKAMGAESASEVARIKADSAKEIAELRAKIATLLQDKKDNTAVAVGAGHDRARITGAGIGAAARENVADKNNKTKLDLEDRRDKNRLEVTDKVTDRTLSAEQTRRMAKENAMALFKNKTPPYPNLKTDSGKTDMGYSSAADVKKAYQAGDLTHDQASKILKSNGWAQ